MKLSTYSKIYPCTEEHDSVVLFSTKRTSAVRVPSSLIEDVETDSLSEDEQKTLAELDLIVRNGEDEKREMLGFLQELNVRNRAFKFTLVLNLDCNLGCSYCFEGTRKGKFYLSDETADRFIAFVKSRDYSYKEELKIAFYGGEPLFSTDRIEEISNIIRLFAEKKGLKYTFSLITNGTLLTKIAVERLVPLGLESAKITLDGPQHVHNRYRPFKSGKGSFDVIVENIKDVCDLLQVRIGGNYTKDNFDEFPALLDYLGHMGLTPEKIHSIKFDPVLKDRSEFAMPDFSEGCNCTNEPWLIDAAVYLRQEILRRGYRTAKIAPSACVIEVNDSVIVHYDGTLYKCPGLIGRNDFCVGTVATGLADYQKSHALGNWKNEECLKCCYLPLCFGGCKYMNLLREGSLRGLDCKKQYFDKALQSFIMQDIRHTSL